MTDKDQSKNQAENDNNSLIEDRFLKIEQLLWDIQEKINKHGKSIDLLLHATNKLEAKTLALKQQFNKNEFISLKIMSEGARIETYKAMSEE
ncbi:hypothetical protein [Paenibacillus aceris]|uniref:Uncharacterized protein n=1 Tax=Paenibacillus aceris TaxID=869555 RepID=A0ABS4I452_9BACL|nr:hypothetical protein [Paenibacillus aceris]MBP1965181.1 hypothetical protein [Paenibacillus aceris]NHW33162.1 hypothetical protein [Paenibacillus aceris]